MKIEEIIAFAGKQGYDGVRSLGKWKEYDAYEPTYDHATKEEPAYVGLPLMILVKDDEIRMSTVEEALEQVGGKEKAT